MLNCASSLHCYICQGGPALSVDTYMHHRVRCIYVCSLRVGTDHIVHFVSVTEPKCADQSYTPLRAPAGPHDNLGPQEHKSIIIGSHGV